MMPRNDENKDQAQTVITQPQSSTSTVVRDFVSSTAAGSVIAFTSFPAEGYKKYLQSGQTQKFEPFRGVGIFAANIVPTTAIQLTMDGYLKKFGGDNPSHTYQLATSFYCGVQGAMFATVVENCILKQQLKQTSMINALREMTQVSYTRPWKSFSMIAARDGIFTAYMLYGGDKTENHVRENYGSLAAYTSRFGLGLVGTALSHPFDMVGTYMQKTDAKVSIVDAAKQIYKELGYKGFFTGYGSRVFMFYTFGTVIPFVKTHLDQLIDNPAVKIASVKTAYANNLSAFFKPAVPRKPSEKPGMQPNVDYVDLTCFRK
jgi:hypothetical protein